jgi:hypothetical protein
MRVKWKGPKSKKRIVDFFDKTATGKIPLEKVVAEFYANKQAQGTAAVWLLRKVDFSKYKFDFYAMRACDAQDLVTKIRPKLSLGYKRAFLVALGAIYRWKLGIPREIFPRPATGGDKPIKLEIQSASEKDIVEFLENGRYNGPLGPFKLSIFQSLSNLGPTDFRIVPWTREMQTNDDERERVLKAIRDVLNNEPLLKHHNFVCKQSFRQNAFYIIRESQLNRIKVLADKGELSYAPGLLGRNGDRGQNGKDKKED